MLHKTRSVFFVLLRPAADGVQDASGGSLCFHVTCRSARSPFAAHSRALSSLEKRPHFGVHFPDAKKAPKVRTPTVAVHTFGAFFAPRKWAQNWPRRMASKWLGHGVPLRAFVSAAGHVTRRVPRATASVCLPFFPCPPERPLSALLALLHVPFISLPCGMVPALSALSGGHEDLLHPVSNLGLQAWKTARLLPGKAPVCLGLRAECRERLGVHQRGSLARARHSA